MTAAEATALLKALLPAAPGLRRVQELARAGEFPGATHSNPDNPPRGEWDIPEHGIRTYAEKVRRGEAGRARAGRKPKNDRR